MTTDDLRQIEEYVRQMTDGMLQDALGIIKIEQARRKELYKKIEAEATSKKEL